ncbi:hypothetical protein FRC00_006102, partial [Tulasnella sp. 408]
VTAEQDDGFKTHWEAFRKYGAKAHLFGTKQRSLPLSARASVDISFPFPPAISSSMCISQIWHVYQARDATKHHPLATFAEPGVLNAISPQHHVREVAADVFNAERALPSIKFIESTLATTPGALNALLLHFENLLASYTDQIISSPEFIQHGNLSLPQALRLAAIVYSSGFLPDNGGLGAISLIRYFQEVIGRSIDYWRRETRGSQELSNLWLQTEAFWKVGIRGLVRALVAGRTDLFHLSLFQDAALGALRKLVDTILSQPAWWDPTNKTLPAIQTIKGKQSIPGSDLDQFLQTMSWSTATFIDRALAMLIVFAGGVQFSTGRVPAGDQPGNSQLRLWTDLIHRITPVDDAEVGPLGPVQVDRTPFLTEVDAWVTVWAQEMYGGPGTRLLEEIERAKAAKTKRAPSPPIRSFRDPEGTLFISFLDPPVKSEEPPAPASATVPASAPSLPQDAMQDLRCSATELDCRTPEGNLSAAMKLAEGEVATMNPVAVDAERRMAGQVCGDSTSKPEVATASASNTRQQPPQDAKPPEWEAPPKRKASGTDDALDSSANHPKAPKRVRIAGTSDSGGVEDGQEEGGAVEDAQGIDGAPVEDEQGGEGAEDEQESNGVGDEQERDGEAIREGPEAEGRVTRSATSKRARGGGRKGGRGGQKSAAKPRSKAKAKPEAEGVEDERPGSKPANKKPRRGRR